MTVSYFYPELKWKIALLKYTVLEKSHLSILQMLSSKKYWYSLSPQLELKKTKPQTQFVISNAKNALWKALCRRKIESGILTGNPSNPFNLIPRRQHKDGRRNTIQILNDDRMYRQKDLFSIYAVLSLLPTCSPSALPAFHQTSIRPVDNSSVIMSIQVSSLFLPNNLLRSGLHILFVLQNVAGMFFLLISPSCFPSVSLS